MKRFIRRIAGPVALLIVRRLEALAREENLRRALAESQRLADRIVTAIKTGRLLPPLH